MENKISRAARVRAVLLNAADGIALALISCGTLAIVIYALFIKTSLIG